MLLFDIVTTLQKVTDTRGRLERIALLGDCLGRLAPDEIEIGVNYLAGRLRQGNIRIDWSLLNALPAAADAPRLTMQEVDAAFTEIASTTGAGSTVEPRQVLRTMLSRATADEQRFLSRLAIGELRQGALEGIMVEAIAKAGTVPVSDVRRAIMLANNLALVARVALTKGKRGLKRIAL
jgi:DNA ligase-1